MKNYFMLLLLLTFQLVGKGQQTSVETPPASDYDLMLSDLRNAYQAIYNLSDNYDFVRTNILPEIEIKRQELAPHIPKRETTGYNNPEETDRQFRAWYELYPDESKVYIEYLKQYVRNYKTK